MADCVNCKYQHIKIILRDFYIKRTVEEEIKCFK